jgi:ABC-type phosphate transport system permease subunit
MRVQLKRVKQFVDRADDWLTHNYDRIESIYTIVVAVFLLAVFCGMMYYAFEIFKGSISLTITQK